jgi:hypothetical protein
MESRPLTTAEREAQILALWRGRAPDRRALEDVVPFYQWLVDYAPWLLPPGTSSADHVRAIVEAHTISPDELRRSSTKERRPRVATRGRQRGER